MNVSCACVPCAYSHERACASAYRVRAWSKMENGDKLGEDSVLCPIRQWSIFKAGPYWKPFP